MPHYNRSVTTCSIVRWHKAQGELVAYGDDLLDLKVDEIQVTPLLPSDVPKQIEILFNAQAAVHQLDDEDVLIADSRRLADSQASVFHLRITSSDQGFLRRIYAAEGDRREVGDLLAVLSAEANGPIEVADHVLAGASMFRVIANMI
jgi:hypothetical protein